MPIDVHQSTATSRLPRTLRAYAIEIWLRIDAQISSHFDVVNEYDSTALGAAFPIQNWKWSLSHSINGQYGGVASKGRVEDRWRVVNLRRIAETLSGAGFIDALESG